MKTALLLIDIQNDYCPRREDGDSGLYCVHIYDNIAVCGLLSFIVLLRGINQLSNSWIR
jgi:hypothetical protein